VPDLLIQFTKRKDGDSVLKCVRADGSATWQKQQGRQAMFFPLHDLSHYAVETELGFRSGFYGLIASGWDMEDTAGKGPRGPLPSEAITVEKMVGSFDVERAGGTEWSSTDFNEQAAMYAATNDLPAPPVWSDEDLARVRTRIRELFGKWIALEAGATLELRYDRPDVGP